MSFPISFLFAATKQIMQKYFAHFESFINSGLQYEPEFAKDLILCFFQGAMYSQRMKSVKMFIPIIKTFLDFHASQSVTPREIITLLEEIIIIRKFEFHFYNNPHTSGGQLHLNFIRNTEQLLIDFNKGHDIASEPHYEKIFGIKKMFHEQNQKVELVCKELAKDCKLAIVVKHGNISSVEIVYGRYVEGHPKQTGIARYLARDDHCFDGQGFAASCPPDTGPVDYELFRQHYWRPINYASIYQQCPSMVDDGIEV